MIKKIFSVFLVTLLAQILSVFSISYIYNRNPDESFLSTIALLDSTFSIITSVLAFGMLQIATRNIVTSEVWEKEVKDTQNIRMSFAFVISIISLISYLFTDKPLFLYLIMSVFIANNVNYALYGRGKSLQASFSSSLRLIINALGLLVMSFLCLYNNYIYFLLFSVTILLTSIFSNFLLKTKFQFNFKIDFYKSYLKNFKIGITDLAIVFLETGILFFADFFYEKNAITDAFIVLKIYVLIKGVQRLIFQIFYNELINNKIVILLNKMIFIIGILFFVTTVLYTNELSAFIFGKVSENVLFNFKISGFSLLIFSVLLASIARTLVIKNDKVYFISFVLSFICSFTSMILLSYSEYKENGIFIALLIGEIVLFLSFFIGIRKDLKIINYKNFYLINFLLLLAFFLLQKYLEIEYAISISIVIEGFYILYFIFYNKKELIS